VEAVLTWGAESLSSHLTYKNIVHPFAPAFALGEALCTFISHTEDAIHISDALRLSQKCLATLFRTGRAKPSEIQQNGRTILFVSELVDFFMLTIDTSAGVP
jgi:hypothetical protein